MSFTDSEQNQQRLYNIHAGHRKRLRSALVEQQWEGFDEHQILEYILQLPNKQKDTNPIAHKLIEEFGSLANVLDASVGELVKVEGVGEVTAILLHSIPNIFKAYKRSKSIKRPLLTCPRQVYEYVGKAFNHMPVEELYALCLDGNAKLIVSKLIAKGTSNEVSFSLAKISEAVSKVQAQGVIILHNHPNGEPKPSSEDISLTRKIFYHLMMNNVSLIDHLIITENEDSFYSFAKEGLLDQFEKDYNMLWGNKNTFKKSLIPYDISKN